MIKNRTRGIWQALVFSVAGGAIFAAESVKLTLKNGSHVQGEILRERDDVVMLDLGFTVLNVPRVEIAGLEKNGTHKEAGASVAQGEDIYYVEPGREPLAMDTVRAVAATRGWTPFILPELRDFVDTVRVAIARSPSPDGAEKARWSRERDRSKIA